MKNDRPFEDNEVARVLYETQINIWPTCIPAAVGEHFRLVTSCDVKGVVLVKMKTESRARVGPCPVENFIPGVAIVALIYVNERTEHHDADANSSYDEPLLKW